jgi:hypothetical protein
MISKIAPSIRPLTEVIERGVAPLASGEAPQIKSLFDPHLSTERAFSG